MPPSILDQLTQDKSPPSTDSGTSTIDLIDEAIDTISIAASEPSNVTDKSVANADLQKTNTISNDSPVQLDPTYSVV